VMSVKLVEGAALWAAVDSVRKTFAFLRLFSSHKNDHLPRQARDQNGRERLHKRIVFPQGRIDEALVRAAMTCEDDVEGSSTVDEWRRLRPTTSSDYVSRDATPHALLIDYADGLRGTVLRIGDDNARWNFACRVVPSETHIRGENDETVGAGNVKTPSAPQGVVRATRVVVGPWRNRYCFKAFSHAIQRFCTTATAPYPVERTLLVTGVL
jgi:hypothetical protein